MIFDFYRQVSLCSLSMSTMYKIITQVATLLSGCLFIGQVTTYWEQDSTADYWEQGKLPLAGNRASFHLLGTGQVSTCPCCCCRALLGMVGLPPTPAWGLFNPSPHDAYASFVLRLRRELPRSACQNALYRPSQDDRSPYPRQLHPCVEMCTIATSTSAFFLQQLRASASFVDSTQGIPPQRSPS